MIEFTRYNFITGEILSVGRCDAYFKFMQAQTDEEHIHEGEQIDGSVWYLPDGVKTPRPILDVETNYTIPADGIASVEIDLPPGSDIENMADGQMWQNESEFGFATEQTGMFRYRIYLPFPYQGPIMVTINAT